MTLTMSCAAILDPRHKVKTVEYCFNKMYGEEYAKIQITKVLTALYKCFEASRKKKEITNVVGSSIANTRVNNDDEEDVFKNFDNFTRTHCGNQVQKSELDLYLEEPAFDRNMELDVLHFWNT